MTLSKYALMQQPSIGPLDTLSIYYILLPCTIHDFRVNSHPLKSARPPAHVYLYHAHWLAES